MQVRRQYACAVRTEENLMNSVLEVLLVLAVVAYVIMRQVRGAALQGKKLIVLPLVLTVVGILSLTKHGVHPTTTDIACMTISAAIAAGIGVGQGTSIRLESRQGALWARMPARGLWWWAALLASRLVMSLVAHGLDAKVAASTAPILMLLGINRVGQALVIAPRALSGSVPFAPEKDGSTFLSADSPLTAKLSRLVPPVPPLDQDTWQAPTTPTAPTAAPAPAAPTAPAAVPPASRERRERRDRREARDRGARRERRR
jgi:hypothetical protein